MPNSKEQQKDYEMYTANKQIKNNFAIGTPEHAIVDIANHLLRLLKHTVYEENFDQERKDVAMNDLMRMNELLGEIKKGDH